MKHQIRVKRGTLGGGPWGYDVELDGERIAHVGVLSEAEAFADGCACGIVALGHDAEISRENHNELIAGLEEERVARLARVDES